MIEYVFFDDVVIVSIWLNFVNSNVYDINMIRASCYDFIVLFLGIVFECQSRRC